jgi:ribosome modulation factor
MVGICVDTHHDVCPHIMKRRKTYWTETYRNGREWKMVIEEMKVHMRL